MNHVAKHIISQRKHIQPVFTCSNSKKKKKLGQAVKYVQRYEGNNI